MKTQIYSKILAIAIAAMIGLATTGDCRPCARRRSHGWRSYGRRFPGWAIHGWRDLNAADLQSLQWIHCTDVSRGAGLSGIAPDQYFTESW